MFMVDAYVLSHRGLRKDRAEGLPRAWDLGAPYGVHVYVLKYSLYNDIEGNSGHRLKCKNLVYR